MIIFKSSIFDIKILIYYFTSDLVFNLIICSEYKKFLNHFEFYLLKNIKLKYERL